MNQLKAKLYEAELQRREAEANATAASKTDIGWGHQIRSYVLQPYQLVKDLRTGVTSTAPSDVLDGDLDRFMAAALSQRVTGEKIEVEDVRSEENTSELKSLMRISYDSYCLKNKNNKYITSENVDK